MPAPGFTRERLLGLLTAAPGAFWRHDVDLSPHAALQMAQFEQVAGVSATYYVMTRGDHYNPFSAENARIWLDIVRMGHRLGLHVDWRAAGLPVSHAWDDLTLWACGLAYLNVANRVSFHMPPEEVLWRDLRGLESAYAARWKDHYVSDSRGVLDDFTPTNDMQINLHPEHWFGYGPPAEEVP